MTFQKGNKFSPAICNTLEDFWSKVDIKDKDVCWNWKLSLKGRGYGQFIMNKKSYLAHRIAYELTYGIISKDVLVCHKCDNPKCCNPYHLFLGTSQDNSTDMINNKRSLFGERNPSCKLTKNKVKEIRILYSTGKYTQKELGRMLGIPRRTICDIVNNKIWNSII